MPVSSTRATCSGVSTNRNRLRAAGFLWSLLWLAAGAWGQGGERPPEAGRGPPQPVPEFSSGAPADLILGRPTAGSIDLSLLRYDQDGAVVVAYGPGPDDFVGRIGPLTLIRGEPREAAIERLLPDTQYHLQVRDGASGRPLIDGRFHTQRPPGSAFTFTVTADSHLDQSTDPALRDRKFNRTDG